MGLDMFSKRVKIEGAIDDLSFDSTQVVDDDFFYWRKNRHLHNWMSNLYLDKGGNKEFNCSNSQWRNSEIRNVNIPH